MKYEERIVEMEIARHEWSKLQVADGPATKLPEAIRRMLSAESPKQVQDAYWLLENHVVVQGRVFSVAPAVISTLLAGLCNDARPEFVKIGILELLFQIVKGSEQFEESPSEIFRIESDCIRMARNGLWLLYREADRGMSDAAMEILRVIDEDAERWKSMFHYLKAMGKLDD